MFLTKNREFFTVKREFFLTVSSYGQDKQRNLLGCNRGEMGSRIEELDVKLNYGLML